jgi:hypothetical protein
MSWEIKRHILREMMQNRPKIKPTKQKQDRQF